MKAAAFVPVVSVKVSAGFPFVTRGVTRGEERPQLNRRGGNRARYRAAEEHNTSRRAASLLMSPLGLRSFQDFMNS